MCLRRKKKMSIIPLTKLQKEIMQEIGETEFMEIGDSQIKFIKFR